MKKIHFNNILNSFESFSDSTDLEISIEGIHYTLSRQNSPYVSHRGIELEEEPRESGYVLIKNRNHSLLILRYGDDPDLAFFGTGAKVTLQNAVGVKFPKILLKNLIQEKLGHLLVPEWLKNGGPILHAYIPDKFKGYSEDGSPIFTEEEESSVSISGGGLAYQPTYRLD